MFLKMLEVNKRIDKLLCNEQELEKLLFLEKDRRGFRKNELVFVGMANIASYYWCAMKSLLKSKKMELCFFHAYLYDRILYSFILGYIKKIPKRINKEILEIGNEINFNEIEELLEIEKSFNQFIKKERRKKGIFLGVLRTHENGSKEALVNPELPPELKSSERERLKKEGYKIVDLEEGAELRGHFYEVTKSEKYPSIRWSFPWENYVILGIPDGITDKFVYEFKSVSNRFLLTYVKPIAFTQADLYGYFFKRNKKRVQIHIMNEDIIETWEETINIVNVKNTLKYFKAIDEGAKPYPPKEWKCKKCEFREICKPNYTS